MLENALEHGKNNKCKLAVLETFNFHAPGFYKKHGFNVDFERKGYKANSTYYYLSKKI